MEQETSCSVALSALESNVDQLEETSCSEALSALESNVDQLEENFAAELAATEQRVKKTIASLVQRLGSYEKREKREKKQRDKEKVLV